MSEMEARKGKLIPTNRTPKEFLFDNGHEIESDWDEWDMVYEIEKHYPCEFILLHGKIYEIKEEAGRDPCGWVDVKQDKETGVIEYDTYFYNGGACLEELIAGNVEK